MRLLAFLVLLLSLTFPRPGAADPLTLHTGRYGMPAVVVGSAIYVVGGCGAGGFLNDIEKIDPAKGTVTDIPTTLLHRRWHTAQASGPYLYIMGGTVDDDTTASFTSVVERYNTRTGKVDKMAPLPTPRRNANSLLYDGKIYVVGGSTNGDVKEVGTVEIYDIRTNIWAEGTPMPTPRECALAVSGGVIYAVGGYNGSEAVSTAEAYVADADAWQSLPGLPVILSAHHVALSGNSLFTFGDYAHLDQVGVYSIKTGLWHTLAKTGYQPSRHNAVVMLNGVVYVIGGNTNPSSASAINLIQAFPLARLQAL